MHDVALFCGIARCGDCTREKIVSDYRLPFHLRAREAQMRRFVLDDNAVFRSVLGQSI